MANWAILVQKTNVRIPNNLPEGALEMDLIEPDYKPDFVFSEE